MEMTVRKPTQAAQSFHRLSINIEQTIKGQSATIRLLLAAFVSGGHVLLEDYPGTGKTTLAKTLANSVQATFSRIQFTPDLLPSDISGLSIYDPKEQQFHFHQGPIFTQVLLADEINRASPRTQSALLESMAERQVTVEGQCCKLDPLFFVMATQNPVEFHGTYPLPEAQMDRFAVRLTTGYLSAEMEMEILDANTAEILTQTHACANSQEILSLREQAKKIRVSQELKRYMVDIVAATRNADGVQLGASPRGSLTLLSLAQTLALFESLTYVTPEHIQEIAVAVLAHRLKMDPQAQFAGTTATKVVKDIVQTLPVPI